MIKEFLTTYADYILSLEDCKTNPQGHKDALSSYEWREAIEGENEEHARDIKRGFFDEDNAPHIFTSEEIGWIIDRVEEDGFVRTGEDALWYGLLYDEADNDWSTGFRDLEDAKRKLEKLYTAGHEKARIAVIDLSGSEPMCIEELTIEDI